MIGEKRSSYQIVREMMTLAMQGHRKTKIMYGANLSYDMLTTYLDFLIGRGYLVVDPKSGKYRVTPEGLVLMEDLERVSRHFGITVAPVADRVES